MSDDTYLSLAGIHKRFDNTVVLGDINLTVRRGEMLCFLGPSGCGKTTLLRIIAGLEAQTHGKVSQNGRDISTLPPMQRDYGIVFQSYALFPNLSVAQNVAYGLTNRRVPRAERDQRVAELLEMVGLPDAGKNFPDNSRAGNNNASPSPARWRRRRACCCWTNRSRHSTLACGCACAARSVRCNSGWASRRFSSRTIRKRLCRWPTASW